MRPLLTLLASLAALMVAAALVWQVAPRRDAAPITAPALAAPYLAATEFVSRRVAQKAGVEGSVSFAAIAPDSVQQDAKNPALFDVQGTGSVRVSGKARAISWHCTLLRWEDAGQEKWRLKRLEIFKEREKP